MTADRFLEMAGNFTEEQWLDDSPHGERRGDQGYYQKWRSGKKKGQYKHLATVDFFKQQILIGETMGTIELSYDAMRNLVWSHEGRHRARAMLELFREGLVDSPNVPVVLKVKGEDSTYGQQQAERTGGGLSFWGEDVYGTGSMGVLSEDTVLYNRVMGDGWKEAVGFDDRTYNHGEHHWRHKGVPLGRGGGGDPMDEKEEFKQAELHFLRMIEDTHHKAQAFFGRGGHKLHDLITQWQDETVFSGGISSGVASWVSIAVDPKKGTGGLESPLNFSEEDVHYLTSGTGNKDDEKSFDNSLDKFVKMLENYPELKEMYEKGEANIQKHNREISDGWNNGKFRMLYRGTTLRNAINLFRARNITKPLKYKNTENEKRDITESTIYKFFSTTLSPAVALDTTLPFAQGGIVIELNARQAKILHKEHDVTGKRSGKKYDKQWEKDYKRKEELDEKRLKEPLTDEERDEFNDLTYGNRMGVLDIAKRPSGKRRKGRNLTPVQYTTYPTKMLAPHPDKNVRNIEQVDTDYRANYAGEQEVRLDLGLPTKSGYKDEYGDDVGSGDWGLFEGAIVNMSSDDLVEGHFEDLGMGDLYRKLKGNEPLMPRMAGHKDMQDFLFNTQITLGDLPIERYKKYAEGDDGYWAERLKRQVSLFEGLNIMLNEVLDISTRQKSERDYDIKTHIDSRKNRKEIRIRYNFINSTGSYDMLENDETGNPDVHYKTFEDWRNKRDYGKYGFKY